MKTFKPKLLLQEIRSGLLELEYYGFIVHCDSKGRITSCADTQNYPFFHRSCAKPLQAAIIADYNTKEYYSLTNEEIAVCCASHTGEKCHLDVLKSLLKKAGLKESDLKCPVVPPLNKEEQERFKGNYSPLHNNCSGKHTLMLAVCRQNNWDIGNYPDKDHPLQKAVYNKVKELCEADYDLPFTLDGCTAPNWATSLGEMTKGFLNLFTDSKYCDIKNAFKTNPYLIGGANRLDTQIMQMNQKLIAKTGAGGLFCVVNTVSNKALAFKIIDADMKARSIIVIETLIQIGWLDTNSIDENLLNSSLDKYVKTETGEIVGEYIFNTEAVLGIENSIRKS